MTRDLKGFISSLVVFILPVVLVKVGGSMFGSAGPSMAAGSSSAVKPRPFKPPSAARAVSWTAQQKAAADHVALLKTEPFGSTPFYYRKSVNSKTPDIEDPGERPPDDAPPDLNVQVVMTTRRGNVALIDGKRYRVGDLIKGDDWRVIKIDGHDRSVTLRHENTERTEILYVPTSR